MEICPRSPGRGRDGETPKKAPKVWYRDAISQSLADRGRVQPIAIDDDGDDGGSPTCTAPTRGPTKKRRVKRDAQKVDELPRTIRDPVDDLNRLRELLRSSKKIVVISGAGISVNAGCESNLVARSLDGC